MTRIGLISDTHGLLRPEVRRALAGCDRILHAGDIGNADLLKALEDVAPVTAVRGNNDRGAWAEAIPDVQCLHIDGATIHVLHDLGQLEADLATIRVVVSGHSHRPVIREDGAVLYVNPGSAGPRRFRLPVSVAYLTLRDGSVCARIVDLTP